LNTPEFALTRELLQTKKIDCIIDFGEHGFEDILVETVCVKIEPDAKPNNITVISVPLLKSEVKKQNYIFDKKFPYWIIYRNEDFDAIWNSMEFDIFTVFRDRQITNLMLKSNGDVRVLKSRNINDDGTQIIDIEGYDSYIDINNLKNLGVYKFLDNTDIYLTPNMTYNPRVMKMPKGIAVNGSVAILIPKKNIVLTDEEMKYFSSKEYREFYRIARNYQTRSLNIDSSSVYFFGRKKQEGNAYEMAVGERYNRISAR
jgi:DNA (cytosine-5)-methyltransferase 1